MGGDAQIPHKAPITVAEAETAEAPEAETTESPEAEMTEVITIGQASSMPGTRLQDTKVTLQLFQMFLTMPDYQGDHATPFLRILKTLSPKR